MSECEHMWKIGMDGGVHCVACMRCLSTESMLSAYVEAKDLESERDFYRQDSVEKYEECKRGPCLELT